jgi:hypothetical protein
MEVGQGPNWGCSAKEKKLRLHRVENFYFILTESNLSRNPCRSIMVINKIPERSGSEFSSYLFFETNSWKHKPCVNT